MYVKDELQDGKDYITKLRRKIEDYLRKSQPPTIVKVGKFLGFDVRKDISDRYG
jgi:hypothetical protein